MVLKPIVPLLIAFFFIISCKKEGESSLSSNNTEPRQRIISRDTLRTGEKWGLAIGDSTDSLYSKTQKIGIEINNYNLSVVGNVFTALQDIENRIPLYTSLFLDETIGTPHGIQISFDSNKVKSIFTNNGNQLNKWPSNTEANSSIAVNDPIEEVYIKLVNISQINVYKSKFQRMSLFLKDLTKVYDPKMNDSPQWYFVRQIDANKYYFVELNLNSARLASIYLTLWETY